MDRGRSSYQNSIINLTKILLVAIFSVCHFELMKNQQRDLTNVLHRSVDLTCAEPLSQAAVSLIADSRVLSLTGKFVPIANRLMSVSEHSLYA